MYFMVHRDHFPPSDEDRALQLLADELGATSVDAPQADTVVSTPRPVDPRLETVDPYYEQLAEEDGARLAAQGIAKVTTNGNPLTLLKGKPITGKYEGPMEIDL